MSREKISEAMGMIHEKYVNEAALFSAPSKTGGRVRWGILGAGAAAACLAAAAIAGAALLPKAQKDTDNLVSIGGLTRPYKDLTVTQNETSIVWPWEYLTVCEQYAIVGYGNQEYLCRGMPVGQQLLGDAIGSCDASGCDPYSEQTYQQTFNAWQIQGISEELLIAVEMDGEYYVFARNEYAPPESLGELIDSYNLKQTLAFDRFDAIENGSEKAYYALENDDAIWQILSSCRDAVFIKDDTWTCGDRDYLSFTITSDALGVYKSALYVTADGYLWTNIFDWAYLYYIGGDAAGQIMEYALEHGVEQEPEPYCYSLAGVLTEIGDDYILIDDSILCENENDGIVFQIPSNNLYIKRCVDCLNLKAGDVAVVDFTGQIDVDNGYIVGGALSVSPAVIADGEVWVEE